MADTGWKSPTTGTSTAEDAWVNKAFSNPGNIVADDGSYASAVGIPQFDWTHVLKAKGFDFSGIPAGATIDGADCYIRAYCVGTANCDLMQLLDTAGARTGTNQCAAAVAVPAAEGSISKGGPADLWGCALTRAWVQDADFGVGVGFVSDLNDTEVYVDYIGVRVYYTEHPSAGGAKCVAHSWVRPLSITGG